MAAAQDRIRSIVDGAIVEVANTLLFQMKSATTYRERGQLAFAQIHILESRELFLASFATALRDRVEEDIAATRAAKQAGETDWQSISLVDEGQIEEKISFERIGQLIAHQSEAELRELDAYMSSLLRHGWADAAAIRCAARSSARRCTSRSRRSPTSPTRRRSSAASSARRWPTRCRRAIARSPPICSGAAFVRPILRCVPPTSSRRARRVAHRRGSRRRARPGKRPGSAGSARAAAAAQLGSSILGRFATRDPVPQGVDLESSAALLDRLIRGGMPGSLAPAGGTRAPAAAAADLELMNLLRRLNGGAGYMGEFDRLPRDTGYGSYTGEASDDDFATTNPGVPLGVAYVQPPSTGLTGLMAANLIRAHRAELLQATRGKLDHLVIEVVSSLFDQILSDARVSPEMARQIARLQLPVLRAALTDGSFFSSRRHPVRRFINRVASLACAFDSFDSGPAKELLDHPRARQRDRRG